MNAASLSQAWSAGDGSTKPATVLR